MYVIMYACIHVQLCGVLANVVCFRATADCSVYTLVKYACREPARCVTS
jgi:hypothetical protein